MGATWKGGGVTVDHTLPCGCTKKVHSDLPSITHLATKVHVIIRRVGVLTWMHDNRISVACDIME